MFSVIIPLYNKENSIGSTIESVLKQTFQLFEIVIVNDGSTDKSVEEVEMFDDKRINLIHQENKGVSAARNKGIKNAKFEWICFLDADDLLNKDYLSSFNLAIQKNPDVKWLLTGLSINKANKNNVQIFNAKGRINNVFIALTKGLRIITGSTCIRKELFVEYDDLYFRENMSNSEDREVWYKLCFIDKRPFYINKPLISYRIDSENSLSRNKYLNSQEYFLTMIERFRDFKPFINADINDKIIFEKFIVRVNRSLLGGRYISGFFDNQHKDYLGTIQYYLYRTTRGFPYQIRRLIHKCYHIVFNK